MSLTVDDFDFPLPPELIAQHPAATRTGSRLLHVCGQQAFDRQFENLPEFLSAGDLLVFNDTRVIKARFFGCKETGGLVEVMLERIVDATHAICQIRASKAPKPGSRILLGDAFEVCMTGRAVAAPTAGLYFDGAMLETLRAQGVNTAFLTLHVGAGTYRPMRVEKIADHRMHSERFEIPQATADAIAATRAAGGRVIAVGTTSLRALESAGNDDGTVHVGGAETSIFITPGYRFKVVDRLITNFHLPKSTLLMLVSAFAGYDNIRAAYAHAVAERYRFFSYGDAMLLERIG